MSKVASQPAMPRRSFAASFGCGILLLLAACGDVAHSLPTYRYRLTVEVETPEGLSTGSSIIEVQSRDGSGPSTLPEASKLQLSFRGEAVAVDLPGGQTLFALLRGIGKLPDGSPTEISAEGYAPIALARGRNFPEPHGYAKQLNWMIAQRQVAELPRDSLPMLVRFRDIADPSTVEKVNPGNLSGAFGAGVKLLRITVQITNDPVGFSIRRRLVWAEDFVRMHFDGTSADSENMNEAKLAAHMSSGSFSTELAR